MKINAYPLLLFLPAAAIGAPAAADELTTNAVTLSTENASPTYGADLSEFLQRLQDGRANDEAIAQLAPADAGELLSICTLQGDLGCVLKLISAGHSINLPNRKGTTALMVAVSAGKTGIAEALIATGADPTATTPFGTPEQFALDLGEAEMIRVVVRDPDATAAAMLRAAIEREDLRALDAALRAGADIDAQMPGGATPLLAAISAGSQQMIEALLKAGASTDPADEETASPLAAAILLQDTETVEMLLRHGADPNQSSAGVTPLSLAAMGGNGDIVKQLLAAGAEPDRTNADGSRPAMVAAVSGFPDVAELLGGADLELLAAVSKGDNEAVAALLADGADPDTRDRNGNPALLIAIARADTTMVQRLLDGGADPLATGAGGATALHVAMAIEDPGLRFDVAEQLRERVSDQGRLAQLLDRHDTSGRSAGVVLAARLHPRPSGEASTSIIQENWQRDLTAARLWFLGDAATRPLVNVPDGGGASPLIAAVLANNSLMVAAMAGAEPVLLPDGSSLGDLARAQGAWASLLWLPDDRVVPPGVERGISLDARMALQELLKRSGYYSEAVDGKIGPATRFGAASFLKDREQELITMARVASRPGLEFETWEGVQEDAMRTLRLRLPAANCTWVVQHWYETRSDWARSFVGCTKPAGEGPWSASGFGLLTLTDGTEQLILTGPNGFDDVVPFEG